MLTRLLVGSGAVLALLALAPLAAAHVTVNPPQAPAGAFVVLDLRVPNESESASTTKVDVLLPPGFVSAAYEPVPGWSVHVTKQKLAQPVQTDDGEVTQRVARITWTATGAGLAPGQFVDFPISVEIPGKAGNTLTFKAVQTYSNGDVVRWIGPESADDPAPRLEVTAPASDGQGAAESAAQSDSDGDGSSTKEDLALGFGLAGLVVALGALGVALFRRPTKA
jgi:uncharacterized protein YcnI